jgi:polygalacturonase
MYTTRKTVIREAQEAQSASWFCELYAPGREVTHRSTVLIFVTRDLTQVLDITNLNPPFHAEQPSSPDTLTLNKNTLQPALQRSPNLANSKLKTENLKLHQTGVCAHLCAFVHLILKNFCFVPCGVLPPPQEGQARSTKWLDAGRWADLNESMRTILTRAALVAALLLAANSIMASEKIDFSPPPQERQLPRAMHSEMKVRPQVSVGQRSADIIGMDNRALQAAVDYVAALGGGTVQIGAGEYVMNDSLHLRPHVTVRGTAGKTILRKAKGSVSRLAIDGDFGEEQITVVNAEGFGVGQGVAIWDKGSGGFHTTVARITGQNGNSFSIDKPLNADCMIDNNAQAATVFPVVSGYHLEGARVEDLIIDGNKAENISLNGCRGAGIFLYRGFGTVIKNCTVRNYHGDGISFQQSNDVIVENCISEDNAGLGLHPGSGSQRPIVRGCTARRNGQDGLFLCWRVRHGLFEKNILEDNEGFGISIGHKDTDNLLRENHVLANHKDGVFFRNESLGMAGHRNRLENNIIENNGVSAEAAGIRVRGETKDLLFRNNIIRDTRTAGARKQITGIRLEELAGPVTLEANQIEAATPIDDRRKSVSIGPINTGN